MKDRFQYRAKDVKTGEWRYGYYTELPCGLGSSGVNGEYADTDAFILNYTKKQSALYSNAEPHEVVVGEQYKIDEKTLSQCTGLRDNAGKLIYEGDIVKFSSIYGHGIFEIKWNDEFAMYGFEDEETNFTDLRYFIENGAYIEILGNLYENSELLEAKND